MNNNEYAFQSDGPPDDVRGAIDTLLSEWKHVKHREQRWQLEKAQLRARILQLEAESRRHQYIRVDLARRIKLLEYGLMSERKRYLNGKAPSKFMIGSFDKQQDKNNAMNRRYRSLPRNFFSKDDLTNMTPGRAFLREYLIELGYLEEVKALDWRTSRHPQGFVNDLKEKNASSSSLSSSAAGNDNSTNANMTNNKVSFAKPAKKLSHRGDDAFVKESIGDTKIWKTAASLRSHMDGVRCISLHSSQAALLSGSEDGTMKLWNLETVVDLTKSVKSKKNEPAYTFRGHDGMITSIHVDDPRNQVYSAGVDGKIMIWQLPSIQTDPYGVEGCTLKYRLNTIDEHKDAVWSVCGHAELPLMFSASADGTVGIWDIKNASDTITRVSTITHGADNIPVVVKIMETDAKKIIVGYTSGDMALYDIETGKSIRVISGESRITDAASHPTLGIVLTGHVDTYVRIFDFDQGVCIGSMQAHRDVVTSVSLDPSGLYMASASHDESIRFWDVSGRKCIQDLDGYQTHRRKYDEAIHVVRYHPSLPLVASGGGDSIIKIYQ